MQHKQNKWFKRGGAAATAVLLALVALLFLNDVVVVEVEAQSGRAGSDTVYRGNVTINGRLLSFGPVMIGPGGSIGIYNSDGEAVSQLDPFGNLTTTGVITAAGFSSDELVRGFETTTARLVGSMAVSTTITGTAVVATGPYDMMSGMCSLATVPTTTVASCALRETVNGDLSITVYTSANAVATLPAVVTWFAWVENAE